MDRQAAGQRLREAVREAGIDTAELARRMGVTRQRISQMYGGQVETLSVWERAAEALGIAVEHFTAPKLAGELAMINVRIARLEEVHNAAHTAASPGATTGSPEPGIIALLDDPALAAGLGLTAEDRAALLELRWCGRIKTVEDALSVVGALLPKVGRPP